MAGKRIDGTLAQIDRMIGVDWPAMIAWAGDHRAINMVLFTVYGCVLPEVALLLPLLGWRSSTEKIYSFCFAIVLATVVTMGFWTFFPSFGAMAVYDLPHALLAHTPLQLDRNYANDLLRLLANGPGFITPKDLKGLIGFPSFHAVLALLVTWYARDLKYVRWPIIALELSGADSDTFSGWASCDRRSGGLRCRGVGNNRRRQICRFCGPRRNTGGSFETRCCGGRITRFVKAA